MPQATNLVLKNGANADKTFTLISPAAGDGGIAEWALKEGTISSVFPRITALAQRNGNRTGRNLKIKLTIPSSFTDSVTGLTSVGSRAELNATFSVPDDFPQTLKADWVAFASGLLATSLLKAMVEDATSAT